MTTAKNVLDFWLGEIGEEGWYAGGDEIDRACRTRFGEACAAAQQGTYRNWLSRPRTALAYMILTDQFSRNIFRGTAEAFANDQLAISGAAIAIARGLDLRIDGVERQFFYLPFEHAENRQAQSRSVCMFKTRMPKDTGGTLIHARAHREIIRRFGRFPFRNEALGRRTSSAEQLFLDGGGYRSIVEALSA